MGTATPIKRVNYQPGGDQVVYKLDPPYVYDDEKAVTVEMVLVSGVNVTYSGPETFIFPYDPGSDDVSGGELDGSFRGDIDHEEALAGLGEGYEIEGTI